MLVKVSQECLAGREDSDVVYQRSCISETAASVCPYDDLVNRTVLESQSWSYFKAVLVVPVSAETTDKGEFFSGMESIFSENSGIEKICISDRKSVV